MSIVDIDHAIALRAEQRSRSFANASEGSGADADAPNLLFGAFRVCRGIWILVIAVGWTASHKGYPVPVIREHRIAELLPVILGVGSRPPAVAEASRGELQ